MSDKNITIDPSIFVQRKLGNYKKLCEDYDIPNKKLGEGFFGSVEVVQLKGTKQNRAMKKIDKNIVDGSYLREEFLQEIDILKTLDHPNILKVYEFYEDDRYLYMITECCSGKELFDVLVEDNVTFSEQEVMKIMQQCLSALQYAHTKFFTHRDIKPENIMIDPETLKIKIIDWGTSTSFKNEQIFTLAGSSFYIAPEILKKRGYNSKVDIWSLGIVLYLLLINESPYESTTQLLMFDEIKKFELDFQKEKEKWAQISEQSKDLLKKMLKNSPSKRISALQALNHPWFSTQPSTVPQKLLKNKLNTMKSFTYQSKLQMATIQYVASHLMSQQEKDELADLFVHLDSNKDGQLSKEEIFNGYKNLYGEEEAHNIVDKIFSEIDVDKNGTIDYNEFLACTMQKKKLLSQSTLKRAFDLFDVDGDKQITATEIKNVLQNNADTFDSQIWENVVNEVDKDGNGVIDFNEFTLMMDNLVDKQSLNNKRQNSVTPFQMITRSKAKVMDSITEEDEESDQNNNEEQPECKTPIKGSLELPKLILQQKSSSKKERLHKLDDSEKNKDEDNGSTPKKYIKKK